MQRWMLFCLVLLLCLNESRPVVVRAYAPRADTAPTQPTFSAAHCVGPCGAAQKLELLTALVQKADLILRGRVQAIHSFWRTDQRMIESDVTIAVAYQLLGNSSPAMMIRTPGGYLAGEGIGMVSPHAAAFAVGEEVLLFAAQEAGIWRTVGGATGKFLVAGNTVIHQDLAMQQSLDGLLPTIVELVKHRGLQKQLPTAWRHLAASPTTERPQPLTAQPDHRRWTTPHASAAFYINLNSAQIGDADGDQTAFRQAIITAAHSWSAVAGTDFTLAYAGETNATATGYNGVNEVLFMHKGSQERAAAAQVWYTADQTIVEADIWINEDYAWNATGSPDANEVDLQSALLHEFGHWLILGHAPDTDAVMFSRLSAGDLKRELQPPDERGIRAIYPR